VDSGTSYLGLPQSLYDGVLNTTCSSDADCIISIDIAENSTPLAKNFTLEAPEIVTCNTATSFCNVVSNYIRPSGNIVIIGYAVLRNYFTQFDRAGKTISFAKGTPECAVDKLPNLSPDIIQKSFQNRIENKFFNSFS